MGNEANEPERRGDTTRLFQIYEHDLAELERLLPELCSGMRPDVSNRERVRIRRVKDIISNVRWNYGPPTEVRIIPADGAEGEDDDEQRDGGAIR